MPHTRQFTVFITFLAVTMLLFSCIRTQVQPSRLTQEHNTFRAAIRFLTNNLMTQVEKNRIFFFRKRSIVIDPFIDANSKEILKVSRSIERIIIKESKRNFKYFDLNRVTSENLRDADYVMNGTIRLDLYQSDDTTSGKKYYHVSASVTDLKTGKLIGRSDVRISDQNLDYTPTQIYQDSPMYLKDPPVEGSIAIATSQVGTLADRDYYNSLETMAMLVEAETAYDQKDYEAALTLLKMVSELPDGKLMKTYAGMYSTYRRLGRMDLAEGAFAKLLSISVEKNKSLTVKFLFDVNSMKFWRDPDLKKQYDVWLRQIGRYFNNSLYCLRIAGHCSRTGTEGYNTGLSLKRARRIQELMQPYFPEVFQRSKAIGKGFTENIKGTGTDDEHDVIDRRVEFFVVNCE